MPIDPRLILAGPLSALSAGPHVDHSSQQLIERTRSGDAAALGELLTRHLNSLQGYLRLRCGGALREHESCSDLAQSVCREVLADLSAFEYRGEAAFRRWLFEAAVRKLKDRARYWGRGKRDAWQVEPMISDTNDSEVLSCYASFCSPSQGAILREELERIERAFDQLSEDQREVIVLSRVVGMPTNEIAEHVGQTTEYTRVLLSRGLAKLAMLLGRKPG